MSCQCVCTCVRVWVVAAAAAAVALLEVAWELGSSGSVYREASRGRCIPVSRAEVNDHEGNHGVVMTMTVVIMVW